MTCAAGLVRKDFVVGSLTRYLCINNSVTPFSTSLDDGLNIVIPVGFTAASTSIVPVPASTAIVTGAPDANYHGFCLDGQSPTLMAANGATTVSTNTPTCTLTISVAGTDIS